MLSEWRIYKMLKPALMKNGSNLLPSCSQHVLFRYMSHTAGADTKFKQMPDIYDVKIGSSEAESSGCNEENFLGNVMWPALSDDDVLRAMDALRDYCSAARLQRFNDVIARRTEQTRFVFENPVNAGNVFAAFRNLDAFGVQFADMIIDESLYTPGWLRTQKRKMHTALGTQQWLTLNKHANTKTCFSLLKEQGYIIAAADLYNDSIPIAEAEWDILNHKKMAVVIGNEDVGVSAEVRAIADISFHLPMQGFAESLNMSAATAALCAILQSKGMLTPGIILSTRNRILLSWMSQTVAGSLELMRREGIEGIVGKRRSGSLLGNIGPYPVKC